MRGNIDNRCMNCGAAPEHTKHLFYECNLMIGVMRKLEKAIEECGIGVPITLNMMLFHAYGGDISKDTRRDIDDLLMIVKHCLYRARFRENVARYNLFEIKYGIIIIIILRYPTVKQMIVTIILELEKLEASRIEMCSVSTGIVRFGEVLRSEINWVMN